MASPVTHLPLMSHLHNEAINMFNKRFRDPTMGYCIFLL